LDKLNTHIAVEVEQLNPLIDTHRSLLIMSASQTPSDIERSALAFFLHSFYSGLENILKRIAMEIDGGLPQGEAWHRQLLDSMVKGSERRGPVVSDELYETLSEYLAFRHVVRQSYSFNLQWEKMEALVLNCEATMRVVEDQLRAFVEGLQSPPD
jgi:hypothetical protein